jgi:predicted hydrocarbon binding protein
MNASNYYYPNKMGRVILQAMEEVLSHVGLSAVLNLAGLQLRIQQFPPNDLAKAYTFQELSQMIATLETLYGPRGGRGLALRAGRACFKYGIRELGALIGSTDMAFRLLPLETKLRTGAGLFANLFNQYSDQIVRVEEKPDCFYWHIERCPVCWQRKADAPVCHLAVGVLQEALYWASGGKYFNVEETQCIAKGDPACTIVIDKQVIE